MKFTLRNFIGLALLFYSGVLSAQSPGYDVPKIEDLVKIPPSPEAQAFAKYGNVPMNLNTGSPEISIPIHTIQGKEFEVPISLTYDASGIKVEQMATWAGLGWNLTLGGMITRQVRGAPDDYVSSNPTYMTYYGSFASTDYNFVNGFSAAELQTYPQGQLAQYFNFMASVLAQDRGTRIEIQPDIFMLSAPGLSGTIFVNYQTNSAYCMEHPEWVITPSFQMIADYNKLITSWIIVDANGNTFYFNAHETTSVVEHNSYDGQKVYYSAWGLTKIVTKTNKDVFDFGVGNVSWLQEKLAGRSNYRVDYVNNNTNCGSDQLPYPGDPTYTIDQLETSSVSLNNKVVVEIVTKPRSDLNGGSAIDFVRIKDINSNQVKKYKLIHSYFGDPQVEEKFLRLKLNEVQVYGSNDTDVPEKYSFTYNGPELPSRESFAQDFWGYFNGRTTNSTLIPYDYLFDKANAINHNWKGGIRKPDLNYAVAASLASVRYPTGGTTEFTYGLHQTADVSYVDQEYVQFAFFGLTGGTTASNTYNYCDDAMPTPPYPLGTSGTFTIPQDGFYDVKMNFSTAGNFVPGTQFAIIYKFDPSECPGGNCTPKTFCEAMQPGSTHEFLLYGTLGANGSSTTETHLTAGNYGYLALNNDIHESFYVEVWGAPVYDRYDVGGLRVLKTVDKDINGSVASSKYYYYGDAQNLTSLQLTAANLLANPGQTGLIGAGLAFQESRFNERPDLMQPTAPIIQCTTTTRFSSSKSSSSVHVAYPVVTVVEFDALGQFNGYEITEFAPGDGNRNDDGFNLGSLLKGRPTRKRVYDGGRTLRTEEKNFYSQRSISAGVVNGFYFKFNGGRSSNFDMYVKAYYDTPNNQFYTYEQTSLVRTPSGDWGETHCGNNGNVNHLFSYQCDGCTPSQAQALYLQRQSEANAFKSSCTKCFVGGQPYDDSYFKQFVVTETVYTIALCKTLGGIVDKVPYSFPKRWATQDRTEIYQYNPSGTLVSVSNNYYDNLNHYQITRTETTGSDGVLRKVTKSYAHDMQTAEPSNPVWSAFVTSRRIAEPIDIKATYGTSQPDFEQRTYFRSASVNSATVYVPDKIQVASGAGSLEDRIYFHQYDALGNIIELSKARDSRSAYLWGYDNTVPVAMAKNAKATDIYFTSFEYGTELGNSSDAHCGTKSSTVGFSKTITGLSSSKSYLLSYWQKVSGTWTYQSATVTGVTSYAISLSGQVDDVRFHPSNAIMTTYTYQPMVGITSSSDPNNMPSYFEYDSKGRLVVVRDYKGKVIKSHEYHLYDPSIAYPVTQN